MRITTVFAMFLLAGATTAAAEPKQEETSGRVSLNEPDQPVRSADDAPRSPGDWVELADPSPAKHGTVFVMVGKDAGSFGKLRLEAAKGTVLVKNVRVFFDDGKAKTYKVNKAISAKGNKYALVDLKTSRTIDRISVTTDRKGGTYAVHGSTTGEGAGQVAGR